MKLIMAFLLISFSVSAAAQDITSVGSTNDDFATFTSDWSSFVDIWDYSMTDILGDYSFESTDTWLSPFTFGFDSGWTPSDPYSDYGIPTDWASQVDGVFMDDTSPFDAFQSTMSWSTDWTSDWTNGFTQNTMTPLGNPYGGWDTGISSSWNSLDPITLQAIEDFPTATNYASVTSIINDQVEAYIKGASSAAGLDFEITRDAMVNQGFVYIGANGAYNMTQIEVMTNGTTVALEPGQIIVNDGRTIAQAAPTPSQAQIDDAAFLGLGVGLLGFGSELTIINGREIRLDPNTEKWYYPDTGVFYPTTGDFISVGLMAGAGPIGRVLELAAPLFSTSPRVATAITETVGTGTVLKIEGTLTSAGGEFIGQGLNSVVFRSADGLSVSKILTAGDDAASTLASAINKLSDTMPKVVPSVRVEGSTITQKYVTGLEYDKLGDVWAKAAAEANMNIAVESAEKILLNSGLGTQINSINSVAIRTPTGQKIWVDPMQQNFRFAKDGTIVGWFDPYALIQLGTAWP